MKITFVCLGNICRSPMAEFIAKNIVKKNNYQNISITSAGTANYHSGDFFHDKTRKVLEKNHVPYDHSFQSKQINQKLFDESDYIVVMDNSNWNDVIQKFGNSKKVIKMADFSTTDYNEIPDPWYHGNFDLVYDLLSEAIENMFAKLNS